jgi:hypothetical protein
MFSLSQVTEIYRSLGMTKLIIEHLVDQIFIIFDK